MSGWQTIFEDQVEGRCVTVKVYQSDADEDQGTGPAIRVLTASRKDDISTPAQHEDDQTLITGSDAGLSVTIKLSTLDDLKEALVEIGFSREAAATIASKVQDQLQLG